MTDGAKEFCVQRWREIHRITGAQPLVNINGGTPSRSIARGQEHVLTAEAPMNCSGSPSNRNGGNWSVMCFSPAFPSSYSRSLSSGDSHKFTTSHTPTSGRPWLARRPWCFSPHTRVLFVQVACEYSTTPLTESPTVLCLSCLQVLLSTVPQPSIESSVAP